MTDSPAATPFRIQTLDVLRGLAVLGILSVNVAAFGLPIWVEFVPEQLSFANAPGAGWAQWVTEVFFQQKFVTLFSLLFGVSLFLVGGEKGDPTKTPLLKRRLFWLAVFGLLHGLVFWFGDILLLYAWCGLFMSLMRSWPAKRLIWIGAGLTLLLGLGQALTSVLNPTASQEGWDDYLSPDILATSIQAYQSGWPSGLIENLKAWGIVQGLNFVAYSVPILCLMMLGLGLFKSGFFHGRLPRKIYLGLIAAAAVMLCLLGLAMAAEHNLMPQYASSNGWGLAALSFPIIITLGYASVLILATPHLPILRKVLGAVGQMAFTNYLAQTLILTSLFSMPWGPRLMGQVDYVGMWGLVIAVWILQLIWSPIWMKHFRMGPFEWGWRCLTHRQRLPLRRV